MLVYAGTPSYLGGRDRRSNAEVGLGKRVRPYLKISERKRTVDVVQVYSVA
jgi:hypothetical protein